MYNETNLKYEIAQAYAHLGLHVFPVHAVEDGKCTCGDVACTSPAKHPLTDTGCKAATTDAGTLKSYFTGEYDIANVGLATGKASGVFVLDVDDKAALDALENEYGTLPDTWTAKTGNGGVHVYFRYVDGLKNAVKFSGALDVRTDGGYVIVPPSVHASGKRYTWIVPPDKVTLADAPAWLVSLIPKRETITVNEPTLAERAAKYVANVPPAISGQRGHDATFALACNLVELFGSLTDDELVHVLGPWNATCEPPWNEHELRHKITEARTRVTQDKRHEDASVNATVDAVRCPLSVTDAARNANDAHVDDDVDDDDWPTLHEDAYHGIAGDFVKRIEPETEADPVAVLVTLLNAFGSIVGRGPHYATAGVHHHANTYTCIVGQSSRARKGTSLGYVRAVLDGVDATWDDRRVNGLSSGEGVIAAVCGDEDANEGTVTIPDRRLWIVETEFGQTLKVLRRDGNTLSPVLRNAWDGGTLSVLTKTSPLRATDAHVSVLAHVTADELQRALSDVDTFNGFANRFVWVLSKRSKLLPHGGNVDVSDIRERLTQVTQQAKTITKMQRSSSASTLWETVYEELVSEKRGTWDAVTSRAEAQTLRLSMLYALLDGSSTIDETHLRAALAVWRYADDSARLIFGVEDGGTLERRIVDVLRDAGRPLTKTEIRDRISSSSSVRKALPNALVWLVNNGRVDVRRIGRSDVYTLSAVRCPSSVDGHVTEHASGQSGQNGQRTADTPTSTPTATLGDVLDWSNANGNEWMRMADGSIWVTNDTGLTSALTKAIHAHQDTLASIVTVYDIGWDWDDETRAFHDELVDVLETGNVSRSRPLTANEYLGDGPTHTIDANGHVQSLQA